MKAQEKTRGSRLVHIPEKSLLLRQPLVEIIDCNRIILENHKGIIEYSNERICVKVSFGCVKICGQKMELARMYNDQLVILGDIHSISFVKRGIK